MSMGGREGQTFPFQITLNLINIKFDLIQIWFNANWRNKLAGYYFSSMIRKLKHFP